VSSDFISPKLLGLLVGGLLPALLFGASGVFSKTSSNAGMPVGGHLIFIGLAVTATGLLCHLLMPGAMPSAEAIASSSLLGFSWALGVACLMFALIRYQAPLAKLVPLYNMNTLITVALALIIFAEWKQTNPVLLLLGSILIIAGGVLVSVA
jgi:drug/metabolite transporter (DMT)-like permease